MKIQELVITGGEYEWQTVMETNHTLQVILGDGSILSICDEGTLYITAHNGNLSVLPRAWNAVQLAVQRDAAPDGTVAA